jgi:Ni/Co efflux regulator RcnB
MATKMLAASCDQGGFMFKHVVATLVALSVLTTSAAIAEPRGDRDYSDHHSGYYERDRRHDHFHESRYDHGHRHWLRGERLPAPYYAPRYIVHNYHGYDLRRPPRGCHWVRVGRDAVLAAVATGIVLDVVYDRF